MMRNKDNWVLIRARSQHFTADEKALIRIRFFEGRTPSEVGRELQCASRTISVYYEGFRAEGLRQPSMPARGRPRVSLAKVNS